MLIIFPDQLSCGYWIFLCLGDICLLVQSFHHIMSSSYKGSVFLGLEVSLKKKKKRKTKNHFFQQILEGWTHFSGSEELKDTQPQALILKALSTAYKMTKARAKPTFYFPTLDFILFSNAMTFLSGSSIRPFQNTNKRMNTGAECSPIQLSALLVLNTRNVFKTG